jgi:hypothetical protein
MVRAKDTLLQCQIRNAVQHDLTRVRKERRGSTNTPLFTHLHLHMMGDPFWQREAFPYPTGAYGENVGAPCFGRCCHIFHRSDVPCGGRAGGDVRQGVDVSEVGIR